MNYEVELLVWEGSLNKWQWKVISKHNYFLGAIWVYIMVGGTLRIIKPIRIK